MPKYILTSTEAKLLGAISEHGGTNSYHLASATKMTHSQVSDTTSRLVRKRLAKLSKKPALVELTRQGQTARRLLDRPMITQGQLRKPRHVVIIADEISDVSGSGAAGALTIATGSQGVAEIDAALNEAVGKMQRGDFD